MYMYDVATYMYIIYMYVARMHTCMCRVVLSTSKKKLYLLVNYQKDGILKLVVSCTCEVCRTMYIISILLHTEQICCVKGMSCWKLMESPFVAGHQRKLSH